MYKYEITEKGKFNGVKDLERSVILIVEDINDKEEVELKLNVGGEGELHYIKDEKDRYKEINELLKDRSKVGEFKDLVGEQTELDLNNIRNMRVRSSYILGDLVLEFFEAMGMVNEETTRKISEIAQGRNGNAQSELEELMESEYNKLDSGNKADADKVLNKLKDMAKTIVYTEASKLDDDMSRDMADNTGELGKDELRLVILETKESYENLHISIKSRCDLIENGRIYSVKYVK